MLSTTFGIVLVACIHFANGFRSALHPLCESGGVSLFNDLEDITEILHGSGTLSPEVCVFNPAVLHLKEDLYLWAARTYTPATPELRCDTSPEKFMWPISYERGAGRESASLVFALTRTSRNAQGKLTHELWSFEQLRETRLEDPRLFQAASGSIWMIAFFPKPAGLQTVTLIEVRCSGGGKWKCEIWIGGTRVLFYANAMDREKNWIPHNGTTRMSYPHYPSFGPHSGFDWGSYRDPVAKNNFDFNGPLEFFFTLNTAFYRGLLEFSGSTPAILYDDGQSYIAAGHIRAHPTCFHNHETPTISATCAKTAESTGGVVPRKGFWNFTLPGGSGIFPHHEVEYAMFFYRFSSKPPYDITHISHAYMPCSYYHYGITYPSGLTRLGPDYLVSYGDSDRYCRIMTITPANMAKLLIPIAQMSDNIKSYTLCTMPCPASATSGSASSSSMTSSSSQTFSVTRWR